MTRAFGNGVKAEETTLAALAVFVYVAARGGGFEHVINLAISLGGDTDTAASMAGALAGALAGAFWGCNSIPPEWKKVCEGTQPMLLASTCHVRHCQGAELQRHEQ